MNDSYFDAVRYENGYVPQWMRQPPWIYLPHLAQGEVPKADGESDGQLQSPGSSVQPSDAAQPVGDMDGSSIGETRTPSTCTTAIRGRSSAPGRARRVGDAGNAYIMAAAMNAHRERVDRKRAMLAIDASASHTTTAEGIAALRQRVAQRNAGRDAEPPARPAARAAASTASGAYAEPALATAAAAHAAAFEAWHAHEHEHVATKEAGD